MTSEQALKMAKAKLECIERQTSGKAELCNNDCESCSLCYEQGNMGEQKEWLKMAIKTLEPCEDCISRQTVLEYIEGSEAELGHSSENELVCQDIKELPPVTPTRKKGHWINGDSICPCCGEDKFKNLDADIWADWQPKYCPNCGSFMTREE